MESDTFPDTFPGTFLDELSDELELDTGSIYFHNYISEKCEGWNVGNRTKFSELNRVTFERDMHIMQEMKKIALYVKENDNRRRITSIKKDIDYIVHSLDKKRRDINEVTRSIDKSNRLHEKEQAELSDRYMKVIKSLERKIESLKKELDEPYRKRTVHIDVTLKMEMVIAIKLYNSNSKKVDIKIIISRFCFNETIDNKENKIHNVVNRMNISIEPIDEFLFRILCVYKGESIAESLVYANEIESVTTNCVDTTVTTHLDDSDDGLCCICLEREKDTVFLPCSHLAACESCMQMYKGTDGMSLDKCPLCNQLTESTMHVFT